MEYEEINDKVRKISVKWIIKNSFEPDFIKNDDIVNELFKDLHSIPKDDAVILLMTMAITKNLRETGILKL